MITSYAVNGDWGGGKLWWANETYTPNQGPVGPGDRDENGKRLPVELKEGDRVLFQKYSGTEFKLDGEELLILSEKDILAIVEA